MLINLCSEAIKIVFEGNKIWRLWNASVYYVYPVVVSPVRRGGRVFYGGGAGAGWLKMGRGVLNLFMAVVV